MLSLNELSDQYPQSLGNMKHSLDIWHKACKLTAKLSAVPFEFLHVQEMVFYYGCHGK